MKPDGEPEFPDRLVTSAERRRIVPLSDATVYRREFAGTFPRRRRIGIRCFWLLSELVAFIRTLPQGSGRPLPGLTAEVYDRNRKRLRAYNAGRRQIGVHSGPLTRERRAWDGR